MSGNEQLQVRAGLNAGLVTANLSAAFESAKAQLLSLVTTEETVVVEGSADELRGVSGTVVIVHNTSGIDVSVALVYVRADGGEISRNFSVANGAISTLAFQGSCPFVLAPGDKVVLRTSVSEGPAPTDGITALGSWFVFDKFTLSAVQTLSDEAAATVTTIPPGVFADIVSLFITSGFVLRNFDTVEHTFRVYLNTGEGPDQFIEEATLAAHHSDVTTMLGNFGTFGLAPGWSVKVQLTEGVTTVAPDATFLAARRDNHDD